MGSSQGASSVTGPGLATLCPDLSLMGTRMGMSFDCGALGLLIGNPFAGFLLDSAAWIGPATFCGAANISACGVHPLGKKIQDWVEACHQRLDGRSRRMLQ